MFELLQLISGDIEICLGPTPREIPELDTLLKAKGLHIFHQNMRGLLCNKDYLVELIDSFKKVQVFSLTETQTLVEGERSEYTYKIIEFGRDDLNLIRITNDMESLINMIASNSCDSIKYTTIVPCSITDHELIGCVKKKQFPVGITDLMTQPNLVNICPRLIEAYFIIVMTFNSF